MKGQQESPQGDDGHTLYGYDVLASAVHLTASTLAILAPEVVFQQYEFV